MPNGDLWFVVGMRVVRLLAGSFFIVLVWRGSMDGVSVAVN